MPNSSTSAISQLTPSQALQQAVQASTQLLAALNQAIQPPPAKAVAAVAANTTEAIKKEAPAEPETELTAELTAEPAHNITIGGISLTLIELANIDLTQPAIEKLQTLRDQLLQQTFSQPWQEAQITTHQASFEALETLDEKLQSFALELRSNLHQLRTENQQGRRAISAYGQAKGQFSR